MTTLVLPVRRKWFEQIRDGKKLEEYRLYNDYWRTRLERRTFDRIIVMLGYPKRDDHERRLTFPWRGYLLKSVTSEEWGNEPQRVFAIRLAPQHEEEAE